MTFNGKNIKYKNKLKMKNINKEFLDYILFYACYS